MVHRLSLDPLPIVTGRVLFDITRLIRSVERSVATGIDRIDLAIALDLVERFGSRCLFVHQMRGAAFVPEGLGRAVLGYLDTRWHGGGGVQTLPRGFGSRVLAARAASAIASFDPADVTYVVASHSGVFRRAGLMDRLDPDGRMARLVYLHDLIPLEYPEYQTPRSVQTFGAWLTEAVRGQAQVLTNSQDTADRLTRYASKQGWALRPPLVFMPRIARPPDDPPPPRPDLAALFQVTRPVFLTLGTIEPRKNHALLLDLWRTFVRDLPDPPVLLIAGRRGWMNFDVFEILDWDETLDGHVHEYHDLTDAEVAYSMTHARALLGPSFAEGLGLPVMEAAAHGLPVIASDLTVVREVAAKDTVLLAPDDRNAWRDAILAMAGMQGA